jgi:signal peptidase II
VPRENGERKALVPFVFLIAVSLFILDQATKFWIRTLFSEGQSRPVIPGIFHLTFVTNTGSAFGLFPQGGIIFIALSIFTIVSLLVLVLRKRRNFSHLVKISLGFLLGGVCGNLVDRLRFGAVLDFLDFRIWPVFNIADSSITIGVILLSIHLLKKRNASYIF